jgi:hypothetical protein
MIGDSGITGWTGPSAAVFFSLSAAFLASGDMRISLILFFSTPASSRILRPASWRVIRSWRIISSVDVNSRHGFPQGQGTFLLARVWLQKWE